MNGQVITEADLRHQLESSPAAKQEVALLIRDTLLDQYAKAHNIMPSDADIQERIGAARAKYPNGQYEVELAAQGLKPADVAQQLHTRLILERALGNRIPITDRDVYYYFRKDPRSYDTPEEIHARQILVSNFATAQEVERRLKAGTNFATLAQQYSTDPYSKGSGGDLGYFARGRLPEQVDDVVFQARVGKISQPIKSPLGYHIVEVLGDQPGVRATWQSARAKIIEQLRQGNVTAQQYAFVQQLRDEAHVIYYDQRYSGAFPASPNSGTASPSPAASP